MKGKPKATALDKVIGENIKKHRLEAGLSLQGLAAQAGVSYQQLQKYERGDNAVKASRLYDIAQFLNKDLISFYANIQ